MANEEYLTISSTLEPPHSLHSSLAAPGATTSSTALHSQPSGSSPCLAPPHPSLGPHLPATTAAPLSLPPQPVTPTTGSLAHAAQPLTKQPPKATHHLIHQGLHSAHYKVGPTVPPPQPPPPALMPITTQVVSSIPPCTLALPPTALPTAHSQLQTKEDTEKRDRHCGDDDEEEDFDDEEEESRRKASLC